MRDCEVKMMNRFVNSFFMVWLFGFATTSGAFSGSSFDEVSQPAQRSDMQTVLVAANDPTSAGEATVADAETAGSDSAAKGNTKADGDRVVKSTAVVPEFVKYMFYGFVGGMILNLMPCVLPVIGLKIMSFAAQAGESRSRVILLNVFYVAGIVSVFVALAFLAAFFKLGWGQQFQSAEFGIVVPSPT